MWASVNAKCMREEMEFWIFDLGKTETNFFMFKLQYRHTLIAALVYLNPYSGNFKNTTTTQKQDGKNQNLSQNAYIHLVVV